MSKLATTKDKKLLYAFAAFWLVANITLVRQIVLGQVSFAKNGLWIAILVLLPCVILLMYLIRNPISVEQNEQKTLEGKLSGLIFLVVIILLILQAVLGRFILFLLPIVAVVYLLSSRPRFSRREWLYATILSLIAGAAGLGAKWITFITPVQWGFLQIPLTFFSFLAGWNILHHFGLLNQGVGRSRFLSDGILPALRSFLFGVLLSMPWALAIIVMGSAQGEKTAWVSSWWQPWIAIQPGIAEEAWGRILMVPLVFMLFRRVSPNRTAFFTALVVMAYWFSYLHSSGDIVSTLVSTLIVGSLFTLPISIVCLFDDLETAIGFHFWMDFLKFVFALFLINR